jgi:hypothetical protein
MRFVLMLLTPLISASVDTPAPIPPPAPARQLANRGEAVGQNCRGKIERVRQERGLPKLDRGNATDERPVAILAVDRQVDGCEVLVMKDNASDIRPLPHFSDGPAHMRPLR